jgi:hypothetical protein
MDLFAVAFLVFAALFLGGVLLAGLIALFQIRTGRRERMQMKQHLRRMELAGR